MVVAAAGGLASPAVAAPAAPRAPAVAAWDFKKPLTLRDRCGGANGWVQWTNSGLHTSVIQTYGLVWTNPASCGGPGVHYVKLTWDDPTGEKWSSASNGGTAGPGQTVGFNSGVIDKGSDFDIGHIVAYLCSTEGTGNCNSSQAF
jgi:hypothetical protein